MKQEVHSSKVFLGEEELSQLVSEVKETLAAGIGSNRETESKNIFSAADLWRIQRMKKTSQRRSTLWN